VKPNKYQLDILKWVNQGEGNATCNAVAGSGKSTTLHLVAKQLRQNGLSPDVVKIIVFGKQNSLDLIRKFGREWKGSIQTLHSLGFRLLAKEVGRFKSSDKVDNRKYRKIAQDLFLIPSGRGKRKTKGTLVEAEMIDNVESFLKLINLSRLTLCDLSGNAIEDLVTHFNLEGINECNLVAEAISRILQIGQEKAIDEHLIDYTDMIWLPVEWGLNQKGWFPTYDFVLVDECQDLNAAQLELSLMIASGSGRSLYVGDPKQAIYGFAGADNKSYQNIVEITKAKELPLDLCYRCPKSHIRLVNSVFPEIPIKAIESASEGILKCIDTSDLWEEKHQGHLVVGDMVLCRKTAPLVNLCIRLIGRGIPATVRGKDIGKQIKLELKEISEITGFVFKEFGKYLNLYKHVKFERYKGRDNEEQLKENLKDKLEALLTVYTSNPNAKSISDIELYIDNLFSDEESPITLATCHRAKGLENERIFILKPEDMPMIWERQLGWQKGQEKNLLYVALTRSKSELYLIETPGEEIPWFTEESDSDDSIPGKEKIEPQVEALSQISSKSQEKTTVNELQFVGISEIKSMIEENLDFEQKCKLVSLLDQEIVEEKKEKTINALMQDPCRSDRLIAKLCSVSAPFVSKNRRALVAEGKIQAVTKRIDKRGDVQKSSITLSKL